MFQCLLQAVLFTDFVTAKVGSCCCLTVDGDYSLRMDVVDTQLVITFALPPFQYVAVTLAEQEASPDST